MSEHERKPEEGPRVSEEDSLLGKLDLRRGLCAEEHVEESLNHLKELLSKGREVQSGEMTENLSANELSRW